MASTFEVLAEPRRREILDLLLRGERPVGELVDRLTLSQPAVSKHLRVLREAGLVEVRHDAQRRWYRLRAQPLAEVDAWLAPYRQLWNTSLDALERHLDAMPDGDDHGDSGSGDDSGDGPDRDADADPAADD
jgi:DNA-binding transcriptional ArsR family regulator